MIGTMISRLSFCEIAGEAMTSGARLLLMERVLAGTPSNTRGDQVDALSDLSMMVRTGGRERSREDFRRLLANAGFVLKQILQTGSSRIIEAELQAIG